MTDTTAVAEDTDLLADVSAWLDANWDPDLSVAEWWARVGAAGWTAPHFPREWGGLGYGRRSVVATRAAFARHGAVQPPGGLGILMAAPTICTHGTEEQVARLVPPLAQGIELGAFVLTEPEAGSDASALRTRADADGRITGTKQFITTGSHAHTLLVFARDPDDRISASVVRRPAPGLTVEREEEKLGLNSSSTATLAFDGTPGERLGAPGAGMRIALGTLDGGRIGIAAQAVGIAQAALDVATAYAKERRAFGGPIGRFGQIQQKLADMQTDVEAARALTWRAARLKQAGRPHTVEGAQAKLLASRVARHHTGEAIQVLGGAGYTREFPLERYYRDAKVTEIYEGTSEIQRLVIARALLGEAARAAE